MSQDSNDYYLGGHGHDSRRRGDRRPGSDSRHYAYASQYKDVDPSWTQPLQPHPSSYHEGYPSIHPTTSDRTTPRHRPELPEQGMVGQYPQQYASDMSSASNYTHEPTYREGYGSSASNYTREPTYREEHGSYPTGHGFSAAYPRHQPSQTGRSEPHEWDRSQGYGVAPSQNQYIQDASRAATSPTLNRGSQDQISTPPSRGSGGSDYPVPAPITQPSMRRIQGGTSAESTLDPRYQVPGDSRNFFKPGRVFSTLWHESQGSTYSNRTLLSEGPVFYSKYGEPIFSQIRRMVVYKQNSRCSWCFAIYTYNGQGVAKRDVNVQDHAVVYNQGSDPRPDPREPRMTKRPLEFVPSTPDQALDTMSRLNFGKIYTVEHNVKVLKVGRISSKSMATFTNYARSSMLSE
ncbi:hypothetical protein P168DRAFT_54787 [Aspergillus campestris IBT 28561]|uniref:DUF6590 domain-containing protein n=1 Tax=Aspergillus campestris (strain IBT 28561) TaxID=1392248 RepID=A0A2I1CVT0_ASPC2|nr:uncharacterized protein P168DRAFT_54787 [Aspergillus campestris IBT 28561]PKY01714.1 hypothetical protein P168DRAFT_54787 [Aspergillus campestris IBT 28561]